MKYSSEPFELPLFEVVAIDLSVRKRSVFFGGFHVDLKK
jgi:hypothetical protein